MPKAAKAEPAWLQRRPVRIALVATALIVIGVILWLVFGGQGEKSANAFTGYVVTENIYMSSPVSGTLISVSVQRGQRITKGAALFRVDPTVREAQTEQARAQIAASEAQLDEQRAALNHARDDLAAAQADADRYAAQLKRQVGAQDEKPGSVAQLDIDQTRASYQSALGQRNAAQAQVASAVAAIAVAEAQLRQSQAGLTSAQRQLYDLSPIAPSAGRVEDVMFKPGESVNANVPIVSIVPDGEVKVRFYVPEYLVNAYKPGRRVAIGCDGCSTGMSAVVNFIASRPEYTPPVIYSLDARQKLVFLVEALPSDPRALVPGQPMDVADRAEDLPEAMTAAIDVKGLNKSFGDKHVVRDVSIQVGEGRITGFLGPNGAGKTTTLRLLCGLLTPDSGEGRVLGFDFRTQTAEIKRQTGYMTQRFSLYEDMTIEENLSFIARIYSLTNRAERVTKALEDLGLQDRRSQLAGALSGGWKQRLALAAATLHDPRLLLLDEPTAGVDPKARREFWDQIHTLAERGLTVLVSTHYMDEAERCHDIGYILNGKLIARGTAEEIIGKSGLVTFHGEGPDIGKVAHELDNTDGVLSASAFGASVHVSGTDKTALEQAIKPYRHDPYKWEEVPPSLEDVFIQLMGRSKDDRYVA